jgi:hypothetical protein
MLGVIQSGAFCKSLWDDGRRGGGAVACRVALRLHLVKDSFV